MNRRSLRFPLAPMLLAAAVLCLLAPSARSQRTRTPAQKQTLTRPVLPLKSIDEENSDLFPASFRACFKVTSYLVSNLEGYTYNCTVTLKTVDVPESFYEKFKREIGKERGYKPQDMALCQDLREFAISGKVIQADVIVDLSEGVWNTVYGLYFGPIYCTN